MQDISTTGNSRDASGKAPWEPQREFFPAGIVYS